MHTDKIRNILKLDTISRYDYSIREIVKLGQVWGVATPESWVMLMDKDDRYSIEMYTGEDSWRGNYARAQWAGRVLEDKVFPKILDAIRMGKNEGWGTFDSACRSVMQDLREEERKKLIRDMWVATWASREQGDQMKSCW